MNRLQCIRFPSIIFGIMAICMAGSLLAKQRNGGNDWGQLRQLAQNTDLKVVLKDAGAIQGKLISADEASVTLISVGTQRKIRRDDVLRAYQQKRRSRGRHALIGAAIGAGSGLGAGAIVDARSNDTWFPNAGKQVLTPIGAIVGAIIGAVWPTWHWQEIYYAPSSAAR